MRRLPKNTDDYVDRFPEGVQPLPLALVSRIVKFRVKQSSSKKKKK